MSKLFSNLNVLSQPIPKQLAEQIQNRIKFEQHVYFIAACSGLKPSEIEPHLQCLTEFEIETIGRAFGLGEFDERKINLNLSFIMSYIISNGREMYEKQMATAKRIYNLLEAMRQAKIQAGTF